VQLDEIFFKKKGFCDVDKVAIIQKIFLAKFGYILEIKVEALATQRS
jgi:hypothetical protein